MRFLSGRDPLLLLAPAGIACVLALAWVWRPLGIVHGFVLGLLRNPAIVTVPLLAALAGAALGALVALVRRRLTPAPPPPPPEPEGPAYKRSGRKRAQPLPAPPPPRPDPYWSAIVTAAVFAVVALVFSLWASPRWTHAALGRATAYGALDPAQLDGGDVRVKPYEVAVKQLDANFSSPTEQVTNVRIAKVDGKLTYTGVRDPEGFFRRFTRPTTGTITTDATTTSPGIGVAGDEYQAEFEYGPGMRISQSVRWQVYKKVCFVCDVSEVVALPTPDGPVLMANLISYDVGFFTSTPEFGGVALFHPDGRIEELSPEEAAEHELVAGSGRMFPEALARRIADAYRWRMGTWNGAFRRRDAYEVADTDANRQPYLQDFEALGLQWVTTLKPRGRSFATGMVMTTDAVTGETRVWRVPPDRTLIGNERALDIVRGERLGVNFAAAFRAIEPRQVFPGGRMQFLISVVPAAGNRVTLNVIVDAERQEVVKVFPATEQGDADLIAYLDTGQADAGYDFGGAPGGVDPDTGEPLPTAPVDPSEPSGELPTGTDATSTLERLLEQNRRDQQDAAERLGDLKAQEADLERLLERARELDEPGG